MRSVCFVLFALISQIHCHGPPGASHGGQPQHVTRKMEEYVHDMEYKNSIFNKKEIHSFFFLFKVIFDMILKVKLINQKNR